MNKVLLLAFISCGCALFQISCNKDNELKAAQYEFKLREEHLTELETFTIQSPEIEKAILIEEEKIITLATTLYKLTGRDVTTEYGHGSGPYNAYLVIAKRPDISLFAMPKDHRPPLIDERLRSVRDVISVKLIRRVEAEQCSSTQEPAPKANP